MSVKEFTQDFERMQDDIRYLKRQLIDLIDDRPDAINIKGVTELTGLHPNTIKKYCNNGSMPHSKVGGAFWFSRSKVESWLTTGA